MVILTLRGEAKCIRKINLKHLSFYLNLVLKFVKCLANVYSEWLFETLNVQRGRKYTGSSDHWHFLREKLGIEESENAAK